MEEPGENITEELAAEQIDTLPSEEERALEEDEPASVGATSNYCGSYVQWTLSDAGNLTIFATGNMWDYRDVDGYNESPFFDCGQIKSITIESGVTSIGSGIFENCTSLTSVTIPHGVKSIGAMTFSSCSALNTITFEGNAPKFDEIGVFEGVTANAYYPYDDPAWTARVRQNYGGNITWLPVRRNGKTGFSDMTNNVEFDKAIAWAAESNITTGYTDGTFRPYNSCLRLAVATFLYRMSNWGRISATHFCMQK